MKNTNKKMRNLQLGATIAGWAISAGSVYAGYKIGKLVDETTDNTALAVGTGIGSAIAINTVAGTCVNKLFIEPKATKLATEMVDNMLNFEEDEEE